MIIYETRQRCVSVRSMMIEKKKAVSCKIAENMFESKRHFFTVCLDQKKNKLNPPQNYYNYILKKEQSKAQPTHHRQQKYYLLRYCNLSTYGHKK
jgi:hypothetical protein